MRDILTNVSVNGKLVVTVIWTPLEKAYRPHLTSNRCEHPGKRIYEPVNSVQDTCHPVSPGPDDKDFYLKIRSQLDKDLD